MKVQFLNNYAGANALFSKRIWWLALLGLIGICIYIHYDARVFPSTSIDLKKSRPEIIQTARQLASTLGYNKLKGIESTQFTVDHQAKTFLEYELGVEQANKLMKDDLPIWSWRTRFCQEHEQEELKIWLNTAGSLQAFSHEIENDRQLPPLSQKEAYALACQFINEKTGLSIDSYNLIKSASYNQSHRKDYSFTWQDNNRDFHGAKPRIHIGVAGNTIDQFNYYLYVPESFERKYSTLRSYNELLESIASIFYSLLQLISIFVFFWAVSTKRIRWRFAIFVAALVTTVDALESFNDIASVVDSYNTAKLFSGYMFEFVIQCLVSCLTKFINYLMLAGAAELVYRISYPKKIACENLLNPKTYSTKSFIQASLVGHILVGISLGWIVSYYLSGKWWHVWCPSGVDNYQVLSTVVPAFSAIATGLTAAISEEFLYRVLALGLFQRLTRSFWLANLFQATAWGFMHSTYPQEPAYARGIELTVIGLIHGWILRRYGLWACFVAHYLLDALLSVQPFFGTHDFWLAASSIVPIAPFLALLIFSSLKTRRGGVVDENVLQNRSVTKLSPRAPKGIISQIQDELKHLGHAVSTSLSYVPSLSNKTVLFLLLVSALSLVSTGPLLNYQAVNKDTNVSLKRRAIVAFAKKELLRQDINPNGYKVVATLADETDSLEMQYIFEQKQLQQTLALAQATKQGLYWIVSFFKPLDPKEYEIWLTDSGAIAAFNLTEPEDSPGANLSEEIAKDKVELYLKTQHWQWLPYKFESSLKNKRQARTDYTFTFTVPHLALPDADFKVSVGVVGDTISGFDSGYDLPDRWLNERNRRTAKDEIFLQIRTAFKVIMSIAALIWAFGLLKTGKIKWQVAYFCALFVVTLLIIQQLNDYPQFYRGYLTTEPIYSYILRQATSYMQSLQSSFLYYLCGFALAVSSLHIVAPHYRVRAFISFLVSPFDKQTINIEKSFWLKSWLIAFSVIFVHAFINALSDLCRARFSPGCPRESLSSICALSNVFSPFLAIFIDAISTGLNQLMLVGILSGLYKRYCSRFSIYVIFVLICNLITYSSARYWQDYLIDVAASSVWEISIWYFIVRIIGVNPLAYFLIGFMDSLLLGAIDLVQHGGLIYVNAILLSVLLILAPLVYAIALWVLARNKNKPIVNSTS